VQAEAAAAQSYALWGVLIPAGAGVVFAMATDPSKQESPPVWQIATLASLFGVAGTWGTSLGYYRGGFPLYATLSGTGKTALLATGILLDRWLDHRATKNGATDGSIPLFTVASLVTIITWDVVDLMRVKGDVRRRSQGIMIMPTPIVTSHGEFSLGLCGLF
jgi:hypothetical protein